MNYLSVRGVIYDELENLYSEAMKEYQDWIIEVAAREMMRADGKIVGSEKTRFHLRVIPKGISFYIYWYKVKFFSNNGRLVRTTKLLKPHKYQAYPAARFKDAGLWESELIEKYENRFSQIRSEANALARLHQSLSIEARKWGEKIEAIQLKDRIHIKVKSIDETKNNWRKVNI